MSTEVSTLKQRADAYRDYPIELKASVIAAIEANGGNVLATSKLFNLPRDTVNYWWKHSERFVEVKHASATDLASKLENVAGDYVDSVAAHDQSIISAKDKMQIAALAIDRMQLLRGLPTSIVENVERNELTVILAGALSSALDLPGAIDVTPSESDT